MKQLKMKDKGRPLYQFKFLSFSLIFSSNLSLLLRPFQFFRLPPFFPYFSWPVVYIDLKTTILFLPWTLCNFPSPILYCLVLISCNDLQLNLFPFFHSINPFFFFLSSLHLLFLIWFCWIILFLFFSFFHILTPFTLPIIFFSFSLDFFHSHFFIHFFFLSFVVNSHLSKIYNLTHFFFLIIFIVLFVLSFFPDFIFFHSFSSPLIHSFHISFVLLSFILSFNFFISFFYYYSFILF